LSPASLSHFFLPIYTFFIISRNTLRQQTLTKPLCLISFLLRISLLNTEGGHAMTLKLSNLEAVAVMSALQHYLKEVEKMGEEEGIATEKKTLKGLLSRMESMPAGEVP
jgi:hypothetical protein